MVPKINHFTAVTFVRFGDVHCAVWHFRRVLSELVLCDKAHISDFSRNCYGDYVCTCRLPVRAWNLSPSLTRVRVQSNSGEKSTLGASSCSSSSLFLLPFFFFLFVFWFR